MPDRSPPVDYLNTAHLHAALNRWANGASWNAAFGLTAQGFRNWQRDQHIRRAFELCGRSYPDLLRLASRWESAVWPRWRKLEEPPADSNPIHVQLFHARRAAPLPGSERQYRRIIDIDRPHNVKITASE